MNGKLVIPNVTPSHKWTGDSVGDIAGQRDFYIRPTYPLDLQLPVSVCL